MKYQELERSGRLKSYEARPREIERLLQVAQRDLLAADRNLAEDEDWSYSMAYNALLQAARALMFSRGYRPRGKDQHRTVVRFTKLTLGHEYRKEVALFDQMRRKRNRLIYESVGLVSQQEAEQALAFARKFVKKTRLLITGQLPLELSGQENSLVGGPERA